MLDFRDRVERVIGNLDPNKKYMIAYLYAEDTPPKFRSNLTKEEIKEINQSKQNYQIIFIAEGTMIWKDDET